MKGNNDEMAFVSVETKYLETLEESYKTTEWQKGYIAGIDDGIAFAERILQAMQQKRSDE